MRTGHEMMHDSFEGKCCRKARTHDTRPTGQGLLFIFFNYLNKGYLFDVFLQQFSQLFISILIIKTIALLDRQAEDPMKVLLDRNIQL